MVLLSKAKPRGRPRGKAEGIASGLVAVLAARGLELPPTRRDWVLTTTDVAVLSSWLNRAIGATSLSDVFDLD